MLQHEERLAGVHPDLQRVVRLAGERLDLLVLEGVRTVARERELIAHGASALKDPLKCRHCTGHAVDLGALVPLNGVPSLRWDWPLYARNAEVVLQAAKELGIPLEWGGGWRTLKDGPHYQLPWKAYPWSPGK